MRASMAVQCSKRLRGQPPESQGRSEVGSADSREAPPHPGFANSHLHVCTKFTTTNMIILSL